MIKQPQITARKDDKIRRWVSPKTESMDSREYLSNGHWMYPAEAVKIEVSQYNAATELDKAFETTATWKTLTSWTANTFRELDATGILTGIYSPKGLAEIYVTGETQGIENLLPRLAFLVNRAYVPEGAALYVDNDTQGRSGLIVASQANGFGFGILMPMSINSIGVRIAEVAAILGDSK